MKEVEKTKKLNKGEILTNFLWSAFGIIGSINYYSKAEYWIFGIMLLIGIIYVDKLFKSIIGK